MPAVTGTAAFCLQKPARNPRDAHKALRSRTLPIPIARPTTRIACRNWGCVSSSRRKRPFPSEETRHAKPPSARLNFRFQPARELPVTRSHRPRPRRDAGSAPGGAGAGTHRRGPHRRGPPRAPGPARRPRLRRFPFPRRSGAAGRDVRLGRRRGAGRARVGGGGGREGEGPGALPGSHVGPLGGRPRPPAGKPPPDAGGERLLPAPSRRREGGCRPSCHLRCRGQGTEPCGTDGQQKIPSSFLEEAARSARSQSEGGRAPSGAFFALCNKVGRVDTVNACREKCLTS